MTDCMIIPTYWSTPDLPSWGTFDHPTPLTEEGTLGRTLESLEAAAYPAPVVLFPVPMDPRIEARVREIAAGRTLDIRIFSPADHRRICAALGRSGFSPELLLAIDMGSYGGVRNMGLLYAAFHGFENVIMIDDDECIDGDYRRRALRAMGDKLGDAEVLGKTGCVVDAAGRKFYDGQASRVVEGWPKDELFNEAVKEALEASESLSPCTVAFGGNMVINRRLFLQVPFDPFGSRGEDDDYVLNARYCGFSFFFDQELLLLHLPPERQDGYWRRQRQDILRFKYLREKLRCCGIDPNSLDVFLRHFTQADLEYKAVSSSIRAARRFIDQDRNECEGFLDNAIMAESLSREEMRSRAERFLRFLEAWRVALPKMWAASSS